MVQTNQQRLTLIVDPRFSGGTSAAVAREIYALSPLCHLSVVAISSKLFKGDEVHPQIQRACDDTNTRLTWDPAIVSSNIIALHNPSFLKFNTRLATRLICDRLFVVCHENFIRPNGPESFDVGSCLDLISNHTLARKKYLSPVSGWNRLCTESWMASHPSSWQLSALDWTNICDFKLLEPTSTPRDRRGRHSRPGLEKYPAQQELELMFPQTSEAVRLLGADGLLDTDYPPHWDLLPFGAEDVDAFLRTIDFFVYFTHPFWQESFGRVIAEAMAAGKVVITSKATGATFSDGVVTAEPDQVDDIVARMMSDPTLYTDQVRRGQAVLSDFSAEAFQNRFLQLIAETAAPLNEPTTSESLYDFL